MIVQPRVASARRFAAPESQAATGAQFQPQSLRIHQVWAISSGIKTEIQNDRSLVRLDFFARSSFYDTLSVARAQMSKDPVFLILKPTTGWLPERDWTEILGAAVKNPWSPTDNYAPRRAWKYNKNPLVEDDYNGFVLQKDQTSSNSFEVVVNGLGKLRWGKSTGNEVDLSGKKIYIKRLRRHSEMWKELTTKSDEFQEEVPGWVNDKHWGRAKYQVCLVVGLLICQDVIVAASGEEARGREASGRAPLGTIAEYVSASQGVPISTGGVGDVSAKVTSSVINRTIFEAEGHGKRIFALELKIISSNKSKLVLTDKTPESNRHLGPDDDEVEPNDLLMRDIEPKEWDEILQDEEV